ncbi:hypothetical protein K1719_042662 [Acacia pycnantha]|nr:hypothetical protein K1719_042662 [Acacia pycnantha]
MDAILLEGHSTEDGSALSRPKQLSDSEGEKVPPSTTEPEGARSGAPQTEPFAAQPYGDIARMLGEIVEEKVAPLKTTLAAHGSPEASQLSCHNSPHTTERPQEHVSHCKDGEEQPELHDNRPPSPLCPNLSPRRDSQRPQSTAPEHSHPDVLTAEAKQSSNNESPTTNDTPTHNDLLKLSKMRKLIRGTSKKKKDSEEYHVTEKKEEQPTPMNAFDLISMSKGLNLENLFDIDQGFKRETIVASKCPANEIINKIEEAAKPLGFDVHKKNYKMRLENVKAGRKGNLMLL